MGLWGSSGEKARPRNLGQGTGPQPDTCGRSIFSCCRALLVQRCLGPGHRVGKGVRASQVLICQVHQVRPRALARIFSAPPHPQQQLGSLLFQFTVALQSV